jgi:hypothetical protein
MNNEMINKPPFKVKCIYIDNDCLTVGKEYNVVEVDEGFYEVKNDSGEFWWYYNNRFQIVETPKDKQEFSVGDKVVIDKVSDWYVSSADKNVKVGDIATVTLIASGGDYDVRLTNPNWEGGWWFSKSDVSLADRTLYPQEVVQATLDGKELEIQYTDGTWHSMLPTATTLRHLTLLNFRLKPETPLEGKRKAVIKKLLENKVAVLCKCWDNDDSNSVIVAITSIDDDYTYHYMNNCLAYKYAYAIHDNGDEITNV